LKFYIRDEENLNPGNNLFVTGLSMRTGDRELEDIFSKYGKVNKSVNINTL
jgi:transformer-2 protein